MATNNIMEDIVYSLATEVMKNDNDLALIDASSDDIVAYVLNRIPPRYVTSERGILHGKLRSMSSPQEHVDILFLIYEAINIIEKRRDSEPAFEKSELGEDGICFPHLLGEVFEEETFSYIPEIKIQISIENKIMEMIDEGWKNPYETHSSTRGYFHFWPKYNKETMGKVSTVKFIFSHPKFITKEVELDIETITLSAIGKSKVLPVTLMSLKEGETLDDPPNDFTVD